jgi:hypothetical protein
MTLVDRLPLIGTIVSVGLVLGLLGYIAWDNLMTAEAVNRDSSVSGYMWSYVVGQDQYRVRFGHYATESELRAAGLFDVPWPADGEFEGYRFASWVDGNRTDFSYTATPTWRHGENPACWSVDASGRLIRDTSCNDTSPIVVGGFSREPGS